MVTQPDKAYVMGGTYKIPVLAGLLDKSFVQDLKNDGTFNEASFGREYENLYSLNLSNCKDGRLKSGQFAAKNFQKKFLDIFY